MHLLSEVTQFCLSYEAMVLPLTGEETKMKQLPLGELEGRGRLHPSTVNARAKVHVRVCPPQCLATLLPPTLHLWPWERAPPWAKWRWSQQTLQVPEDLRVS